MNDLKNRLPLAAFSGHVLEVTNWASWWSDSTYLHTYLADYIQSKAPAVDGLSTNTYDVHMVQSWMSLQATFQAAFLAYSLYVDWLCLANFRKITVSLCGFWATITAGVSFLYLACCPNSTRPLCEEPPYFTILLIVSWFFICDTTRMSMLIYVYYV